MWNYYKNFRFNRFKQPKQRYGISVVVGLAWPAGPEIGWLGLSRCDRKWRLGFSSRTFLERGLHTQIGVLFFHVFVSHFGCGLCSTLTLHQTKIWDSFKCNGENFPHSWDSWHGSLRQWPTFWRHDLVTSWPGDVTTWWRHDRVAWWRCDIGSVSKHPKNTRTLSN
jgi:hypothetical protein